MNFLFHVAPQELIDRAISALLNLQISDLELVAAEDGVLDVNIVQPDIIFRNATALVFVEIKVDSRSSIDQFTKYAIAAYCIMKDEPQIESADLIFLCRHADHNRLWKNAKRLGLANAQTVRDMALRGLNHDEKVWSQRGVQSFLKSNPDAVSSISERVTSMGLHLMDYGVLERVLREYAADEKTVERLIDGVLHEFRRRHLIK